MNNTFKIRRIIVCLLMLVNTNFSYSSDTENNFDPLNSYMQLHTNIINDLEQYNAFFQNTLTRLNTIENSIPNIFDNNDEVQNNMLKVIQRIRHYINLTIKNGDDKSSFLTWNTLHTLRFTTIKNQNQLSLLQEQKLDELINICNEMNKKINT